MKELNGFNLTLGAGGTEAIAENLPSMKTILAEVVGIGNNEVSDLRIFSLALPNGNQVEAIMANAYWDAVKGEAWLKEGTVVKVEYEIRKKDSTTYKDKDGKNQYHTRDGMSINRINKGSATVFAREVKDLEDGKKLNSKLDVAEKTLAMFMGILGDGEKVNQEAAATLLGKIMAA